MATDNRRMPSVTVQRATGGRSVRNPVHTWHVYHRPFEIQPVAVAPILAGDSLRSARWEARLLTDPVNNLVSGWWAEYYLFYVRISDLDEAAAAKTLLLSTDETPATAGLDTTDNAWTYYEGPGGVDWLGMAMKPIIRQYFRSEGEDWNTRTIGGIPIAAVPSKSWLDTLRASSTLPVGIGDEDYEGRWEAYEELRRQRLVTVTFVEYLRSQGVRVPDQLVSESADFRKPELLKFVRQFTYPQNTTDPSDGSVAAAASWVVAERSSKRIYADEPGFVVLVSLVRPKVYRSNQVGAGVSLFRNGRTFHSGVQTDAPQETLITRETTASTGPLSTTVDYTADTNGVLALGDQFRRGTGYPSVALPDGSGLQSHYPLTADIDALFAGSSKGVRQDGALSLSITGRRRLDVQTL